MIPLSPTINAAPIMCAGSVGEIAAAVSAGPDVRQTLLGTFRPMIFAVVEERVVGEGPRAGETAPVDREVRTSGSMQPGDEEKLSVKPEGQRSWSNWVLFVLPALDVKTDTVIKIDGLPYRVMAKKDFGVNGYVRYGLTEDFTRV